MRLGKNGLPTKDYFFLEFCSILSLKHHYECKLTHFSDICLHSFPPNAALLACFILLFIFRGNHTIASMKCFITEPWREYLPLEQEAYHFTEPLHCCEAINALMALQSLSSLYNSSQGWCSIDIAMANRF